MADTGWLTATSGVNVNDGGTQPWQNPTNAFTNNNTYANFPANLEKNQFSQILRLTGFGVTIPTGATIDGVQVQMGRYRSSGSGGGIVDNVLRLVSGGSEIGNNKADTTTQWPLTETLVTYGGASDGWGASLTPSVVNDSSFGVDFKVTNIHSSSYSRNVSVDYIQVKIYYTEVGGSTKLLEGAVAGSCGSAAFINRLLNMSGSLVATGALIGGLSRSRPFAGTLVGNATLTGAVKRNRGVNGTLPTTTGLTGAVKRTRNAQGTLSGVLLLNGDLSGTGARYKYLAGTLVAIVMPSAALKRTTAVRGGFNAITTPQALASKRIALMGQALSTAALAGTIRPIKAVRGGFNAVAALGATPKRTRNINGVLATTTAWQGSIRRTRLLASALDAHSVLLGAIEDAFGFEGALIAHTTLHGSLTLMRKLTGACPIHSTLTTSDLTVIRDAVRVTLPADAVHPLILPPDDLIILTLR